MHIQYRSGNVAVVHNGIIENYQELKDDLQALGYVFTSQTDTEVVAHLVQSHAVQRIDRISCKSRNGLCNDVIDLPVQRITII